MKKKTIRLTESDIQRIVEQRIIQERANDFNWDDVLGGGDIWSDLEKDLFDCIGPLVEKYSGKGKDSYEVIDMIYQILDGMFQKVR